VKAGYDVSFVPIEGKGRGSGSKSKMKPWREGFRFLAIILRITTLFSPLRIILPVALSFFLLGVGYTTYTIVTDTDVTDVSVLLFFASAVLFLFGLLSEQIAAQRLVNRGDD